MRKGVPPSRAILEARRAAWKAICARARIDRARSDAYVAGRELTQAQINRIAATPKLRRASRVPRAPKNKGPVTWR